MDEEIEGNGSSFSRSLLEPHIAPFPNWSREKEVGWFHHFIIHLIT